MLVGLTLSLISCVSKKTTIYPITERDVYFQDNGDVCFSEKYFSEVLQLKIDNQ
jgi:hypothetical protein